MIAAIRPPFGPGFGVAIDIGGVTALAFRARQAMTRRGRAALELVHRTRAPSEQELAARLDAFRRSVRPAVIDAALRESREPQNLELIVTCFNHARWLPGAVASIERQTSSQPITITFADDASNDGSAELATSLADALRRSTPHRVRVMANDRNRGQWACINDAVSTSSADVFVILNDDDELAPDCLALTVDAYRRHPELFLLGSYAVNFTEESDECFLGGEELGPPGDREARLGTPIPVGPRNPVPWSAFGVDPMLTTYTPARARTFTAANDLNMCHSSSSFRRAAWEAVGGYYPLKRRTQWADDRDFQMRVCSLFPVGVFLQYPMAYYRCGSSHARGGLSWLNDATDD